LGTHISQPKHNNTWESSAACSNKFAKIKIMG